MKVARLLLALAALSLRQQIAFRMDFLFSLLVTAAGVASGIAAIGIVFTHTETLGGWPRGEAIVLLGTFQLITVLLNTFIAPNLQWFGSQVKNGALDEALLKPISSLVIASLGSCRPLALVPVVLAVATVVLGLRDLAATAALGLGTMPSGDAVSLIGAVQPVDEASPPNAVVLGGTTSPSSAVPSVEAVAAYVLLLGVALVLTWAVRVLAACVTLWFPSVGLDVLFTSAWQFARYPVSIYREPLPFVLTYLIPVAFISTIPAQTLTRGPDPVLAISGLVAAAVSVLLVRIIWHTGLRHYASATS